MIRAPDLDDSSAFEAVLVRLRARRSDRDHRLGVLLYEHHLVRLRGETGHGLTLRHEGHNAHEDHEEPVLDRSL
jgi:hypothetical protein